MEGQACSRGSPSLRALLIMARPILNSPKSPCAASVLSGFCYLVLPTHLCTPSTTPLRKSVVSLKPHSSQVEVCIPWICRARVLALSLLNARATDSNKEF